jgi:hypothetical protein
MCLCVCVCVCVCVLECVHVRELYSLIVSTVEVVCVGLRS